MSKVDLRKDCEKRQKNKLGRKYKRDTKLQELERQLQFAETRCGTLKQQLDYIKLLYGCGKPENSESRPSREEGRGDGANVSRLDYGEISRWNDQEENFRTREDGDCPEFVSKTASRSNTSSTDSSQKQISVASNKEREGDEGKKKSHGKHKAANLKVLKMKKKTGKKAKKRRKSEEASSSKVSNVSSQTQAQAWQDPVVEIYKNSALNVESESGFDIFCKHRPKHSSENLGAAKAQKTGSRVCGKDSEEGTADGAASQEEVKLKSCNHFGLRKPGGASKEEGMQTELFFDPGQPFQQRRDDPVDFVSKETALKPDGTLTEPLKSYCQPTISSRRKQVERDACSNLTNINVRNIPFIAARSTAPSHNIGVNIQQVLSIMKKRQTPNEAALGGSDAGQQRESSLFALIGSKKLGGRPSVSRPTSDAGTAITDSSEPKKRPEAVRTSLSHWTSNSEIAKERTAAPGEKPPAEGDDGQDWTLKVDKLKKVLIFLHEDFKSLSQKYKRLQKKLTKRNITKTDAKDELAGIERELEKKEEEITVVIALYKEVLNLREDVKKLQEKCALVACGRSFMLDGLRPSNSTHTQMTALLRKIQNFQDQLKG